MPIYAYRCGACGHTQDVLQKLSDPALVTCPSCGADALSKQVTAAGFQLKGSGWYVTDFRGGNKAAPAAKSEAGKAGADATPAGTPATPAAAAAPAATDAGGASQSAAAPAADSARPGKPSEAA